MRGLVPLFPFPFPTSQPLLTPNYSQLGQPLLTSTFSSQVCQKSPAFRPRCIKPCKFSPAIYSIYMYICIYRYMNIWMRAKAARAGIETGDKGLNIKHRSTKHEARNKQKYRDRKQGHRITRRLLECQSTRAPEHRWNARPIAYDKIPAIQNYVHKA